MKIQKNLFKPKYSYWLDQDGWTKDETVCLLLDIEPIGFKISYSADQTPIINYNPNPFRGKSLYETHFYRYTIKFHEVIGKDSGKYFLKILDLLSRGLFSPDWSKYEYQPPLKVISWAKQKGIKIPNGLKKAADKAFLDSDDQVKKKSQSPVQMNEKLNYENACIKLAIYYWSKKPKLTISELAREIRENETLIIIFNVKKPKSEKTISNYIRKYAPFPILGRPRKDTSNAPNLPTGNT